MTEEETPDTKGRSNPQVRYYRGVVLPDLLIGIERNAAKVGEPSPFKDTESLHRALKYKFLGSEEAPTPVSMKVLSAYLDECILFAAERAIPIRRPGCPEEEL